jgi:putative glycosyltransferase (TIGR04348 family)
MARIAIITPARPGARNGNRHTATRWARFLRELGHRVSVATAWDGKPCDLMLALHAKRSHAAAAAFRAAHPDKPLVVVLTGTDLYRDLPGSREARASLAMADLLVALQDEAARALGREARTVVQSADPHVRHAPPKAPFRVAVVGHLRAEKDPFRAALALRHLPQGIEVVQVGDALGPSYAKQARALMRREPRYRWLGGVPHPRAMRWIARSHLLVVSSRMEGGANVIAEAARIGTPVLASRVPGNVGMLGRGYPGYFPLGNEQVLARLVGRAYFDRDFHAALKRATAARRGLFAPAAEKAALGRVVREALR